MKKIDLLILFSWIIIGGLLYGSGGTLLWDRSNVRSLYEQKRTSSQSEKALELCYAIQDNDLERLKTTLKEHPESAKALLVCSCYGCEHGNAVYRAPLNDALELDRTEMVSVLLRYGAPEAKSKPMSTGIGLFNPEDFPKQRLVVSFPDPGHSSQYLSYHQ